MIINPMFFYLMYVSENISTAMKIGGPLLSIFSLFAIWITSDLCIDRKTEEVLIRWGKRLVPMGIIIFFIGLLIPDRDTLLLMQASALATTENVNAVFNSLKEAMDYAVTILQ